MLGGEEADETARRHAEALLKNAVSPAGGDRWVAGGAVAEVIRRRGERGGSRRRRTPRGRARRCPSGQGAGQGRRPVEPAGRAHDHGRRGHGRRHVRVVALAGGAIPSARSGGTTSVMWLVWLAPPQPSWWSGATNGLDAWYSLTRRADPLGRAGRSRPSRPERSPGTPGRRRVRCVLRWCSWFLPVSRPPWRAERAHHRQGRHEIACDPVCRGKSAANTRINCGCGTFARPCSSSCSARSGCSTTGRPSPSRPESSGRSLQRSWLTPTGPCRPTCWWSGCGASGRRPPRPRTSRCWCRSSGRRWGRGRSSRAQWLPAARRRHRRCVVRRAGGSGAR